MNAAQPVLTPLTVLMLVLTLGMIWVRMGDKVTSNLPLGYMFVVMLFYRGFDGTFGTWPVFLYLMCVVVLRVDLFNGLVQKSLRFAELTLLAYFVWRLCGLLLGWPV